jgi:hypothetical protein
MDRPARRALPHDRRLALIRDTDRAHLARGRVRLRERLTPDGDRGGEDLLRVVLDVTRRGVVLRDLTVRASADGGRVVEDERGGAGRALVQREEEAHAVVKRRIGSTSAR